MARLFITGDTHNDIDIRKLNTKHFPEQKDLTKDDVLLIAGDFGFPWCYPENKTDKYWLKWYESKPFTTLFIDGNHDNFPALDSYPEIEFHGAKCNAIRPHVLHVKRGEVLEINSHKILCIGGAVSVDKYLRTPGESWWPEEVPPEAEWNKVFSALKQKKPDVIISHDCPAYVSRRMHGNTVMPSVVQSQLDRILNTICANNIPVSKWYFGHHHIDADIQIAGIQFHGLYQTINELR